jgi:acetolactate synthase I/II/III large subunit
MESPKSTAAATLKASDLFVRCLENEGIRYVFGVPGEENEDLLFSLEKSSIQFVPTRHEQGAAFIADMWGRLTGRAGVCLATLGPGATNLVTGVADAFLDKSPVVAITGQIDVDQLHQESHQRIDVVGMFRPITKWNSSIYDPDVIPEVVRKAFKHAEDEKPGATHIELPEDVAKLKSDAKPLERHEVRRPDPDRLAREQAVEFLRAAKKPLIIAGNGALRKKATRQLRALVQRYRIPVVHTFMGKGAVSDRCEQSLLTMGLGLRDFVMEAIDKADLIITVGYDLGEFSPERWNAKLNKKIVHIDFTSADTYGQYQPAVEVVADTRATLREIHRDLRKHETPPFDDAWYKPIRQKILKDLKSYDLQEGQSFTVPGTLNMLRELMADNDLLISDVGSHKLWIGRNWQTYMPNTCIISNGLATMGFALPGGIAAALIDQNRGIVAAMGDGGFLMNSQELETAKRLGVGFVVLVFNDNDYGLISWKQEMHAAHSTGTKLTNPDFKAYAESFGIKGYRPKTVAELRSQLKGALASHELCVIEVPVDQRVNMALTRKLKDQVTEK